ncbi:hypothetical protein [Streptomyces sp. NPDC001744]|uniref:hypothetical protein n=1 Tax=Streptomyces sp. NPDC001744 TaxID=3364606 RepID=UPI003686D94B
MPTRTRSGTRTTTAGIDTRLPWWALALPAAAFVALLLLVTGPGGTGATASDATVGRLLESIRHTLFL